MKHLRLLLLLLPAALACHRAPRLPSDTLVLYETGIASFYGRPFHGRRTASGEIYDMFAPTAAHRTLPFGTLVQVTSLRNGRTTSVRITDRGPFVAGRVIDLSVAAARELDMVRDGVVPVEIRIPRSSGRGTATDRFMIQVGAFRVQENAHKLRERLRTLGYAASIVRFHDFYRIRLGPYPSAEAEQRHGELTALGFNNAFIVHDDPPPR